jgi:protocatechuate 4,5-dioxygenase beta chain
MLRNKEDWTAVLTRMMDPESPNVMPYSAKLELETPGVIDSYIERIHGAIGRLREMVRAYNPEAIIMIGDDQGEWFSDENSPTFAIYTGDEALWGRRAYPMTTPIPEREKLIFPVNGELSRHLHKGLVKKGFDMANIATFIPRGEPERGVSHMVANILPEIVPELDIPIVTVLMNEYYPPLPSAERCIQLGQAIAEVMNERPERTMIYASGGLSHFPGMFNRGWIDTAFDEWLIQRLESHDLEALSNLFTFDSDMMRAGTGEVRAWLSVAACMGRGARFVDYVPAHGAITGCGFAYWPAVGDDLSPAFQALARAAR